MKIQLNPVIDIENLFIARLLSKNLIVSRYLSEFFNYLVLFSLQNFSNFRFSNAMNSTFFYERIGNLFLI
jgi:hypothetical protein